jgi:hypothetical protein
MTPDEIVIATELAHRFGSLVDDPDALLAEMRRQGAKPHVHADAELSFLLGLMLGVVQQTKLIERENVALRGLIGLLKRPCHYCGLDDMAKCARGFPGCALADDIVAGQDETVRFLLARIAELESSRRPEA